MIVATLLTNNELELPCVVLPVHKQLFPQGQEVIVYCQNRLVRGLMLDNEYVSEINVFVEWCIIPELEEILKNNVQSNCKLQQTDSIQFFF